jgi:glycosyltransferase involved in cell wall biosynthesis
MRIAFVTTQAESAGGSHVHVRDVSAALVREGHEVLVLIGGKGPYLDQLSERNVPFHQLKHMVRPIKPPTDVRGVFELAGVLKEFKADVVSTHSSKAGAVGRLAGHMAKIPTLFTAHGWAFAEGVPAKQRRIYETVEKAMSRYSARIICVAEADRQLAINRGIAGPERLVTIHNGMPDSPERADPAKQPPTIVSVARLDEQKDHPTLLRALGELKDLPWTLECVGGGSRLEELKALAQELGIADRVIFRGTMSDVKSVLASSQIFALISNWEGFPRSTLEAMRTGLPAIVSDVAGSKEAIIQGETGFFVQRGSVAEVRDRLRTLLENHELRGSMGQRARQRYEQEFTFDIMFEKTKAVYREVMK